MKIFVTGASGLIGGQLVKNLLEENHTVYSGYNKNKPMYGIPVKHDLLKFEQTRKVISTTKPDIIFHLAALTHVDLCEKQKVLTTEVNVKATEEISKLANTLDSFLIYLSTDYVFDGRLGMRNENDIPAPINFYGLTKFYGEQVISKFCNKFCIARTSTPYGHNQIKKSFPQWIYENLMKNNTINVVRDQITSPTYIPNLAKMLIELSSKQIQGIIHLAGSTPISRLDLALKLAKKMNLKKELIAPISSYDGSWIAKRPIDVSLDVSKASSLLNEIPMSIDIGLDNFINDVNSKSEIV